MNDVNTLSLTTLSLERQGGPRPAWADVKPTSSPNCHRSKESRSCHLRCGGLREGLRGWRRDTWDDTSHENGRCRSGRRLTDTIRRTGPRITNSRPPYPQRARSSRIAREVSGAFLEPSCSPYNRQTGSDDLFDASVRCASVTSRPRGHAR